MSTLFRPTSDLGPRRHKAHKLIALSKVGSGVYANVNLELALGSIRYFFVKVSFARFMFPFSMI